MKKHFLFLLLIPSLGSTQTTAYSIADGNWHDTLTWNCNCIPQSGDSIFIDHQLFSDADIELNEGYLEIRPSGVLYNWDPSVALELQVDLQMDGELEFYNIRLLFEPFIGAQPDQFTNLDGTLITHRIRSTIYDTLYINGVFQADSAFLWTPAKVGVNGDLTASFLSDNESRFVNSGSADVTACYCLLENHGIYTGFSLTGELKNWGQIELQVVDLAKFHNYVNGYAAFLDNLDGLKFMWNYGQVNVMNDHSIAFTEQHYLGPGSVLSVQNFYNAGTVFGSGKICITDQAVNWQYIFQSVDICDLSPTTSIPPILDLNSGQVDPTVTFCENSSCVAGTAEHSKVGQLNIFPNPFSETSLIEIPAGSKFENLRIFDLAGRENAIRYELEGQDVHIHRGVLSSGIYFLELIDQNDRRYAQKIIIQ